jgi:multiple sugar transport system permease protein
MTNFLIAVAINLVGMLVIYSLLANALARFYWHGQGTIGILGTIFLAGLFWIVPSFVTNLRNLEPTAYPFWFGNWLVSGFSVVILCQSVRWLPRDLEDSARLDGCGWFGIYRHVVLPLVRRELGLIALLIATATSPTFWRGLTTSSGYLQFSLLSIGSEGGPELAPILLMITASSVITTLPVMVIFFLSQRWFPRPAKLGNE